MSARKSASAIGSPSTRRSSTNSPMRRATINGSMSMPGGKTIAHGYLTLSLVPRLGQTIYRVKHRSRGLNYGSNRIRFTGQVPAGSRIRLRQKIKAVDPVEGGVRITSENTVEVEGAARPALVAETIS